LVPAVSLNAGNEGELYSRLIPLGYRWCPSNGIQKGSSHMVTGGIPAKGYRNTYCSGIVARNK